MYMYISIYIYTYQCHQTRLSVFVGDLPLSLPCYNIALLIQPLAHTASTFLHTAPPRPRLHHWMCMHVCVRRRLRLQWGRRT